MSKVIVYQNDAGDVSVIYPAPQFVEQYGIGAIAIKDVPIGKPFKIVDESDLPNAPQKAWVIDESDLDDGVGGSSNEFQEAQ